MSRDDDDSPTRQIAEWRARLRPYGLDDADLGGMDCTLLEQASRLMTAGLDPDEALLIAVKRTAGTGAAAREFNHEYAERLWRQLVTRPATGTGRPRLPSDLVLAGALALAAAAAIQVPALFGAQLGPAPGGFYARNFSLLVLPLLATRLLCRHGTNLTRAVTVGALFAAAGALANAFPLAAGGATEILTAIHVPIALWLVVGLAYAGGGWRTVSGRMRFVRFSGEWFIHYVLFALGGGVLTLLAVIMFEAAGVGVDRFVEQWLLPCGAAGAVIVAAWLADGGRRVSERLAPLLARVFTPLFAALLIAFLAALVWTGRGIAMDREVLIAFDLLLVLVVGLLLFAVSARETAAARGPFDALRLVLAVAMPPKAKRALATLPSASTSSDSAPTRRRHWA